METEKEEEIKNKKMQESNVDIEDIKAKLRKKKFVTSNFPKKAQR